MAQRRDFEKAGRIAKVRKADFDRYMELFFGKEPKARGNTTAEKKLTKNERIMQAYFKIMRKQREQAKRAAEEMVRQEKEQKEAQRKLNGENAVDLLFTAIHSGKIDYGKVLGEDWCFDSEKAALYFKHKVEEPVYAEKSEYLCLGFPRRLLEQLECEIRSHLQKTPHAIIRVERILIDRLSQVSKRQCWQRVSESTIRQVFQINKKALKRAQKCWPEIYQIIKETS